VVWWKSLDFRKELIMSEWKIVEENRGTAVIKVIGVGGGGGNAVQHMVEFGLKGADFICINTDKQALDENKAPNKLVLGINITNGLGAGADPVVGREAALEDRDRLSEILKGTDMVFITAGMGGGTGTGAAPAPNPLVILIPRTSLLGALFSSKACLSVLIQIKSAPFNPNSTIC
jgi:hypothetical protein